MVVRYRLNALKQPSTWRLCRQQACDSRRFLADLSNFCLIFFRFPQPQDSSFSSVKHNKGLQLALNRVSSMNRVGKLAAHLAPPSTKLQTQGSSSDGEKKGWTLYYWQASSPHTSQAHKNLNSQNRESVVAVNTSD